MIGWIFRGGRHATPDELSAYADGMLDARSTARIEAHLARCESTCEADLAGTRATIAILRSVSTASSPRSFALRPEQVAAQTSFRPIRLRWVRSPALVPALAATLAAAVFGVILVSDLTGSISQSGRARTIEAVETTAAAPEAVVVETVIVEKAIAVEKEAALQPEAPALPATAAAPEATVVETVIVEKAVAVEREAVLEAPATRAATSGAQETVPAAEKRITAATPIPEQEADRAVTSPAPEVHEPTAAPAAMATDAPVIGTPTPEFLTSADATEPGIRLPLWQLEVVLGVIAAALALFAVLMARRARAP